MLHEGQKIKAVQNLNTSYNISLHDAKLPVDTPEAEIAARPQASTAPHESKTVLEESGSASS